MQHLKPRKIPSSWLVLPIAALLALPLACGDDDNGSNGSNGINGTNGANGTNGTNGQNGTEEPIVATTIVDVSDVFEAGAALRDAYTGRSLTVGTDGRVEVPLTARKVALLERDGAQPTPFSWDSATVYFVITDRFENGDPSNDNGFGRQDRTAEGQSVGTFHGGDFAGLVDRMDYLDDLGVDALWITPPVEQIRGWVAGTNGEFQHWPYHGYWANDFTKLDPNFGTEDDLRALVAAAHERGIRVIFDMVMNHIGYLTLYDASLYVPSAVDEEDVDWTPGPGQNWGTFNDLQLLDYQDPNLVEWWGPDWIRTGFPFHDGPGNNDLTMSLAFLPDLKTEAPDPVDLPPILQDKPDTDAVPIEGATVRDYLVEWHTRWIRDFGIDGFRCDTAKHVELASWTALKDASVEALREWKAANPDQALDDLDFWMVGEAFPPLATPRPGYFDAGFDALINFDFGGQAAESRVRDFDRLNSFYSNLADALTDPNRGELTYASSHDTSMFYEVTNQSLDMQFALAPGLLMNPGAVQIYYGDETARAAGPPVRDPTNALRSDMNWEQISGERAELLEHWQRIGQFRRKHRAIGAGDHARLPTEGDPGYAFSRVYDDGGVTDEVVVVLGE